MLNLIVHPIQLNNMEFRDTWFLTLATVSAFLVFSTDARSWDIAVAIGNEIDFFDRNGTSLGSSTVANTKWISALAYDSAHRTMYMSDMENEKFSLYRSTLTEENLDPHPILKKEDSPRLSSMVFDPLTNTLFWIDIVLGSLMKMEVPSVEPHSSDGIHGSPTMLHNLTGLLPYGIALDICHRFIYWESDRSIKRSRLDGNDRREILNDKLYVVYDLAVHQSSGKLYFINVNYPQYTIEEINLDGTDRKVLVSGRDRYPMYLAVDDTTVYWTDQVGQSVWKVYKNGTEKSQIKSYLLTHQEPSQDVMSIITRDNVGGNDCEAVLERELKSA